MRSLYLSKVFSVNLTCSLAPSIISHADPNPLRQAYFAETHMHTVFSLSAYIGRERLMPVDALSYTKGNPVALLDSTVKTYLKFIFISYAVKLSS